jgi:cob(I)alamin adenosyltransferase
MPRRGYIQVYTGEGKGKTTAALGLAVRAAGAGLRVLFAQFVKGRRTTEHKALERLADRIAVKMYGGEGFIRGEPSEEDVAAARQGLAEVRAELAAGTYDLVVLDEASVAVKLGLFSVEDLLSTLEDRAEGVEAVVTGRDAPPELVERADLVTEMRAVKHYYDRGVRGRRGIEG